MSKRINGKVLKLPSVGKTLILLFRKVMKGILLLKKKRSINSKRKHSINKLRHYYHSLASVNSIGFFSHASCLRFEVDG